MPNLDQFNTVSLDRCFQALSQGCNLHRGFLRSEIIAAYNAGGWHNGIKVEITNSSRGGVYMKVWYGEHYVSADC